MTPQETADGGTATGSVRLCFVCVQNAGRSQMAAAFAEREVSERGLADQVEVASGGTHPADAVHDVVVEVMREVGLDVADREPREMPEAELATCDHVATMGCSTLSLPERITTHDWALDDPAGADAETAREIREAVEARVVALFDEAFPETATA